MTEMPSLFDRGLWLQRRAARAKLAPMAAESADFLHAHAVAGVAERLEDVNRKFDRVALVHPGAEVWAMLLSVHPSIGELEVVELAADETLPLEEGRYDAIISGLTLHWTNDPVGALIQMKRALKPDGLLIAPIFGGRTLEELRSAFGEAEIEEEGGLSPRVAPMGEIRDLGGLVQRAGLTMPVADGEALTVTYADPLSLMRELRAMGETNVMTQRRKTMLRKSTLARMAALYAQNFPDPDDASRIKASFEIVYLTGWSPSPDQPKPLRPGSAKTSLADALGTFEIPAGDKAGS